MTTLITGADGSLGSHLMGRIPSAIGMSSGIKTKERIDLFFDDRPDMAKKLDVLILNHGINHLSWIGDTPPEDEAIMLTNVMAPYWVLNKLVSMRKRKPMRVVFITSQTYRVPQRTTALYCASKAALEMMMRVAARELAPHGWVINAVAPGKIEDTMMSYLTDKQVMELRGWKREAMDEYAKALVPMGRFTTKAEVATAVLKLLELPDYINGTTINVTGGV